METSNQINVEVAGGFKISLPEFILRDAKDNIIKTDYRGRVILLKLLMNGYVRDEELRHIAKSYKSIICKLKKVSLAHDFKILRLRGRGYCLREKPIR